MEDVINPMTTARRQSSDALADFTSSVAHLDILHHPPHPRLTHPHSLSNPIFPNKSEVDPMVVPASMHVPLPDVTVPAMINQPPVALPSPPKLLPNFPSREPFSLQDNHPQMSSSPTLANATTINPPSQLPSPTRLSLVNPFGPNGSSLITPFDPLSPNINPPLSVLPNGINGMSSPNSDHALPPFTGSSSADPAFGMHTGGDFQRSSPEAAGGHRHVVQTLFSRMNSISQSVLDSCTKGEPNEAIPKITELMDLMVLTGSLVLENPSPSLSERSPPRDDSPPNVKDAPDTASVRPAAIATFAPETLPVSVPSFLPVPHAADPLDIHGSRKRCASSMSIGDESRVNKALKMEPEDDHPLTMLPNQGPMPSPALFSGHPLAPAPLLNSPTAQPFPFVSTNPLPSRPPSPSTAAALQGFSLPTPQPSPVHPAPPPPSHLVPDVSPQAPFKNPAATPLPPLPPLAPASFQARSQNRSSWTDPPTVSPHRQLQHSYSAGSLTLPVMGPASLSYPSPFGGGNGSPPSLSGVPGTSPLLHRVSRTCSLSNPLPPPLPPLPPPPAPLALAAAGPSNSFSPADFQSSPPLGDVSVEKEGLYDSESDESDGEYLSMSKRRVLSRPTTGHGPSPQDGDGQMGSGGAGGAGMGHSNEIPQEIKADVDRIFFEYLNKICSDLDATDAKGDPIHQTLMAKKMQRFDESLDFRPFKFRIAAFTHGFMEELARQGYPEDKIPSKKVRSYLWSEPHIVRYNEEGKKVKSKGNHTWNMDAKRMADGTWRFREFHRQLAGAPPVIGYIGLPWSWTPRIWHPQGHTFGKDSNVSVTYGSPSLPSWLSWNEGVLSGTPLPGAESCDVVVEAKLVHDGQEEILRQTIHITIAPSPLDHSFPSSPSRRHSVQSDTNLPRRVASDPSLPLVGNPRAPLRPGAQPHQDAQVLQVLTSAAHRVAQAAHSQASSTPANDPPGHNLQSLVKQQQVLTVTAQALDRGGDMSIDPNASSNMSLAAAAQHVVLSAARQVVADHSAAQAAVGIAPSPMAAAAAAQVTVDEVSAATQNAVAQAVEIIGPLSSEVQVLMTASSLLQWQTNGTEPPRPGPLAFPSS